MLTLRYDTSIEQVPAFADFLHDTSSYTKRLAQITKDSAYQEYESSLSLPSDQKLLAAVKEMAAKKTNSGLKYHIVIGIGGSNLGTRAVYDALRGFYDMLEDRFPKLLFAETTDPEGLKKATRFLGKIQKPEQVLLSIISKSGNTTETLANFEILMDALTRKFKNATDRVVAITDEGSSLWEQAGRLHIDRLAIPGPVGGRYSVLSAVGLFPLATVGIDVDSLCRGAVEMRDKCLKDDTNPAATSATLLTYHRKYGKTINDNFFFHPELESVGKWYRQLMGESIGKAYSLDGQEVHSGITPTVSIGSTDLHSVGQLYLGGPKDKFTTFVYAKNTPDISVPTKQDRIFPELIPIISGKSAQDILIAILEGTKIAYKKAELPFMEMVFDAINEQTLGAFLQFKMLEMMYLGQLLNVDAFDQPSVESYKTETKSILEGAM